MRNKLPVSSFTLFRKRLLMFSRRCLYSFPHYLKVEHFYETFMSQNGILSEEAITITLYGKHFEVPLSKKKPLLGFSDTLGHILLMDVQNEINTDTHRHSSKLW